MPVDTACQKIYKASRISSGGYIKNATHYIKKTNRMRTIKPLFAIIVCLFAAIFASCEDEKDLVVIEGNLPLKTSTLYMVGDATPNGWDISNPTPFTPSAGDALVFVYEGMLHTGELKCCTSTNSWDAPFIHPMAGGREIGKAGVAGEPFQMYAGGEDLKWRVTEAGRYKIAFDLRNWVMTATYVSE